MFQKIKDFFSSKVVKIVAWVVLALDVTALIIGGATTVEITDGIALHCRSYRCRFIGYRFYRRACQKVILTVSRYFLGVLSVLFFLLFKEIFTPATPFFLF